MPFSFWRANLLRLAYRVSRWLVVLVLKAGKPVQTRRVFVSEPVESRTKAYKTKAPKAHVEGVAVKDCAHHDIMWLQTTNAPVCIMSDVWLYYTHIHTHTHIYIYIYTYVCIYMNISLWVLSSWSTHFKVPMRQRLSRVRIIKNDVALNFASIETVHGIDIDAGQHTDNLRTVFGSINQNPSYRSMVLYYNPS